MVDLFPSGMDFCSIACWLAADNPGTALCLSGILLLICATIVTRRCLPGVKTKNDEILEPGAKTNRAMESISGKMKTILPQDFVEVIMFPDSPPACPAQEMYGNCVRWKACRLRHEGTSAERVRFYSGGAERTIDIAMQMIASHQILSLLADLARKGVKIRVMRDYYNIVVCIDTNNSSEKLLEAGMEVRINGKMIKGQLRTSGLLHHKYVIVDGKILMNGSLNFTLRALTANSEIMVVSNHRPTVADFVKEFEETWKKFVPLAL